MLNKSNWLHLLLTSLLFLQLFFLPSTSPQTVRAAGATFPKDPFNGLQVTYSVDGATFDASTDSYSFTNARTIQGSFKGDTLSLSGSVSATSGWGADVSVSIWIDDQKKDFSSGSHPKDGLAPAGGWKQDFSLTVRSGQPLSLRGGFSINLVGDYNAGSRAVVVSGSFKGPGTTLCEEALLFFNENELKQAGFGAAGGYTSSKMKIDFTDLQADLKKGLDKYSGETDKYNWTKPYVPNNLLGTLPALTWLFAEGGVVDAVSKPFVFNQDGLDAFKPDYKVKAGTEPALREAIIIQAQREKRSLTPGDVFHLALVATGGNVRNALLLSHNTLRSLARGGDAALTGVMPDPQFFTKPQGATTTPPPYLTIIREGDNAGPWYHLFGTAFFEVESRGQLGPVTDLLEMLSDGTINLPTDLKQALVETITGQAGSSQSVSSDVTNILEQFYRQYIGNRTPDPEKFCYNVWGGRVGAWLWQEVPHSGTDVSSLKVTKELAVLAGRWTWNSAKDLASYVKDYFKQGTGSAKGTGLSLPGLPGFSTTGTGTSGSSAKNRLYISGSPVNLSWEGAGMQMVLDQESASLYGFYPLGALPVQEKDGSWAAVWNIPAASEHTLNLQGSKDGLLHLFILDPATSQVARYTTEIKAGDKLTLDLSEAQLAPPLQLSGGQQVNATVQPLNLSETAGRGTGNQAVSLWLYIAIGGVALLGIALLGITLFMVARKKTPAR